MGLRAVFFERVVSFAHFVFSLSRNGLVASERYVQIATYPGIIKLIRQESNMNKKIPQVDAVFLFKILSFSLHSNAGGESVTLMDFCFVQRTHKNLIRS